MVKTKTKTLFFDSSYESKLLFIHILQTIPIFLYRPKTLTSSNIIPPILEFLKKFSLKLNPLLTRHVYVYHLNFFMLHLVKRILMVTPVKNSLLKLLTNFILFLTYLYGSQSSSMTARQINIFLLNLKTFLLPFLF